MKNTVVAVLALLFLSSNTEFHELLKAPFLIVDYLEHKAENPDITLSQFWNIHYSSDTASGTDEHHDSQLPFKTAEHVVSSSIVFFTQFSLQVNAPHFNTAIELPAYRYSFISFQLLANIWQPPKC